MAKHKGNKEPEYDEDEADSEEDDSGEEEPKSRNTKSQKRIPEHQKKHTGLRIFLVFLLIMGIFIPMSAYVETIVTSEYNIRSAITKMAKDICEMDTKNPAVSCTAGQLSVTEFRQGYAYKDMVDDGTNLLYYGGGRATDHMSEQQKDYVSIYRLKNFYEYSRYLYFAAILAIIGFIFLIAMFYNQWGLLSRSFMSTANITLFLLFMWHSLNFIFWIGYVPRVVSDIAMSAGESLRSLTFGADFGFSLAKLHLFVALAALIVYIIIVVVRKILNK